MKGLDCESKVGTRRNLSHHIVCRNKLKNYGDSFRHIISAVKGAKVYIEAEFERCEHLLQE